MADHPRESPVRIIGSRELHQSLPTILNELKRDEVRYVLTVHGKPRAVLVGAESYLKLATGRNGHRSETLVGLQLSALLGGELESSIEALEKAFDADSENE
jgi:prevent-host-death family protein